MPDPKFKNTDGLRRGGGRPKIPGKQTMAFNTTEQTRAAIERLAIAYGCTYAGKPAISKLLERIAAGELLIVPAPPSTES